MNGFTLAEMIIVVSIFLILALSGTWAYGRLFERSQVAQIISEAQQIQSAWRIYLLDVNEASPNQSRYGSGNPDAPCHNEPPFFNTDLFTNVSGNANWNGPYMKSEPQDPWGNHFVYDNDLDTYVFDTTTASYRMDAGVNAQLQWCPGQEDIRTQYLLLAPIIDNMLDKGDGKDAGTFRWDDSTSGGLFFLLTAE